MRDLPGASSREWPMPQNPAAERLIARAILAPSSHNTQPWLFEIAGDRIRLIADRTRALPVNDPEDRELAISCGCALFNLRAAAAEDGLGAAVSLLPDPEQPDLLAELTLGGPPDPALAVLAARIPERRTHRKRFAEPPVTAEAAAALVRAAEAEGAWFRPLQGEEARAEAARLVAAGDAEQWGDPRWRRELAQWMHPRRRGDGLALPGLAVPVAQLVVRSFDMGGGVGARDEALAEGSPMLAVLGTAGDGPEDRLVAGQGLQRVLLAAVEAGLQASYLN